MLRAFLIAAAFAVAVPPIAYALDAAAINAADFAKQPKKKPSGPDPLLVKAEVLLDRARFSPGEIDGQMGENFQKALAAFKVAQGLPDDSKLDAPAWEKLTATSSEPVIKDYTITAEDVRGPFIKRLPSFQDMSKLPHMGYLNATEELAERFHMSEGLLRALNPGKSFDKPGTAIAVTNVARKPTSDKVVRIEIDKTKRTLRGFDKAGNLVVFDPASIGSEEQPPRAARSRSSTCRSTRSTTTIPELKFKGVSSKKPSTFSPVQTIRSVRCGSEFISGLRHPRHTRPVAGEQELFARLHPADQLGRGVPRRARLQGHDGGLPRGQPAGRAGGLGRGQEEAVRDFTLPLWGGSATEAQSGKVAGVGVVVSPRPCVAKHRPPPRSLRSRPSPQGGG